MFLLSHISFRHSECYPGHCVELQVCRIRWGCRNLHCPTEHGAGCMACTKGVLSTLLRLCQPDRLCFVCGDKKKNTEMPGESSMEKRQPRIHNSLYHFNSSLVPRLGENGFYNSYIFYRKTGAVDSRLQFIAKDFTDRINACSG